MEVALVFLIGLLDRQRGHAGGWLWSELPWNNRAFEKLLLGFCVALLVGVTSDTYPGAMVMSLIVLGTMLGCSPGWGGAIGPALERRLPRPDEYEVWQVGKLRDNVWLALAARGAIWGACYVPVAFFDPHLAGLLFFAYVVAMPLAVWLAMREIGGGGWGMQEWHRGWIAGTIISMMA